MARFYSSSCMIGCIMIVSCLTGCVQTLRSPGSGGGQLPWQDYQSEPAQEFIDQCKEGVERAQSYFWSVSESRSEIPDLALLNQLNQVQMVLDNQGSRARLYENVHTEPELREAAGLCQQHVQALETQFTLTKNLYQRLRQVDADALNNVDRAYWQKLKQTFERAGVNKSQKKRQRIAGLRRDIHALEQGYQRTLREDVRQVNVDPTLLAGLPKDFIDTRPVNGQGLVTLTTEHTDYIPVMQYAHSDKLRKTLFQQFRSRGYPENEARLQQLLAKRFELAQLLGFDSYAEYLTADKMIGSPAGAEDFINRLNAIAKPRAEQDYKALLQRLQQIGPASRVEEWQKRYLENLVRTEVNQVDAQKLRRYFPYSSVKQGLFDLTQELFGVSIRPWDTPVWHSSIEAFEVWDGEQLIGQFYLDMHPRTGKYPHAAHFAVRSGVAGMQTPISALVCNFPGGNGGADLMEYKQVEIFLHEFGHLLHHIFAGQQPWLALSGMRTERDFAEAPAQLFEEWGRHSDTLKTFARNEQGQVIPDALIDSMNGARGFGRGIYIRHQLFYAALSLELHQQDPKDLDLQETLIRLQDKHSPFGHVENTYMYTNFGHLTNYSAMYYTYLWSQVIAADLFSEFEEVGLLNREVAERYRQRILAPGGAKPAAQLLEDFLGRPFDFDAFARRLSEAD